MMKVLALSVGLLGLTSPCLSDSLSCSSDSRRPCTAGCYLNKGVCETVPHGHFSPDNSNRLFKCRSGYFSVGQAEFCTACPPGQFAESVGSPTCYPCGIAQYSPYAGSRRCRACNPARYIGYGSLEVEEVEGIVFCVEPKDTNWTLNPSASPTLAASEGPQAATELSPSASPEKNSTIAPSFTIEEPTSVPSVAVDEPTNDPSSSQPSFRRTSSSVPSQTPSSSLHPSVTDTTQSPSNQHFHTENYATFSIWKVLLPNFGAAFIITCFAWLLIRKSPKEEINSPLRSTITRTTISSKAMEAKAPIVVDDEE